MLTAIGEDVSFVLSTGRRKRVYAPERAWAMYDDDGEGWPVCSLLVASLPISGTRPIEDDDYKGFAKHWLGRSYDADVSTITMPPKSLSAWTFVGNVSRIYYLRRGNAHPDFFKHDFNKPTGMRRLVFLVKGKRDVALYQRGKMYRLDLGERCLLTRSGLEVP